MNKGNVSKTRIQWTTKALNSSLNIHNDVKQMRIKKEDVQQKYVASTLADSSKLTQHIKEKIANSNRKKAKLHLFDPNFLYIERDPDLEVDPPSDSMEEAFSNLADFFVKHQDTWDNGDRVEIENDDDTESDEDEPEYD